MCVSACVCVCVCVCVFVHVCKFVCVSNQTVYMNFVSLAFEPRVSNCGYIAILFNPGCTMTTTCGNPGSGSNSRFVCVCP